MSFSRYIIHYSLNPFGNQTNRQDGGFDWKKLKESYSNLPVALTELEEQRHAFVLRNHKDEPRMVQSLYVFIIAKKVFFNEKSLDLTISPDFKTMWDEVCIPSFNCLD